MVMGRDSRPKVVVSNPCTVYWMDIFTYICCKNCNDVCLKRPKIKEKKTEVGKKKLNADKPYFLRPRVRIPSTPSLLFSICIVEIDIRMRKEENKTKKMSVMAPPKDAYIAPVSILLPMAK